MKIHIRRADNKVDVYTIEEVNDMLSMGVLDGDEPAWTPGTDNWTILSLIKGVVIPAPPSVELLVPPPSSPLRGVQDSATVEVAKSTDISHCRRKGKIAYSLAYTFAAISIYGLINKWILNPSNRLRDPVFDIFFATPSFTLFVIVVLTLLFYSLTAIIAFAFAYLAFRRGRYEQGIKLMHVSLLLIVALSVSAIMPNSKHHPDMSPFIKQVMNENPGSNNHTVYTLESSDGNTLYREPNNAFAAAFPCQPRTTQLKHPNYDTLIQVFTCETDKASYGVIYFDYPTSLVKQYGAAISLSEKNHFVESLSAKVLKERNLSNDKYNALEIKYTWSQYGVDYIAIRRFILIGNRAFTVYANQPSTQGNIETLNYFVNSFTAIE